MAVAIGIQPKPIEVAQDLRYRFWRRLLTLILISLFLFPAFQLTSSLPRIRVEEVIVLVILIAAALRLIIVRKLRVVWNIQQSLLVIFMFYVPFAILFGFLLGFKASLGDLNQVVRVIKYILIYTFSVSVLRFSPNPEQERYRILNVIIILSLLLSVVAWQQYFNLFGLNERYIEAIAPTQYKSLQSNGYSTPRPIGMVGNPNELAFIYVLSSTATFFILMTRKIQIRYLFALGIQLITLVSTLSRTSLFTFIIVVLCLSIGLLLPRAMKFNSRYFYRISFFGLIGLALVILFISNRSIYQTFTWRFAEGFNLGQSASFQDRVLNWRENLSLFRQSPFFGVGPLRYISFEYAADNEWLLLLRSYGIFGTLLFVVSFALPQFIRRSSGNLLTINRFRVLTVSLLLGSAVYMITLTIYHSLVLMPLLLIMLSLSESTTNAIQSPK